MTQPITVIALCYNHAQFVETCLESILAQTFQNFQLIVTDDCSRDNSPQLIESWLGRKYPSAIFIHHTHNVGLCKTLNEAISHATGRFISMIATDDSWEPDKLALQFAALEACSHDVAVLYSDAFQMDESGKRLPETFLRAHGIAEEPPRGHVFSRMADGNFIPAMTTLIRLEAIRSVGGYDEELTYEDYDMWLRLADRYRFEYYPAIVANYRLLSTSMVRTLFEEPTPAHAYTIYLIARKWLATDRLSQAQRRHWNDRIRTSAYILYVKDDPRAIPCLWTAALGSLSPRIVLLALTRALGLKRSRLKKMVQFLGLEKP